MRQRPPKFSRDCHSDLIKAPPPGSRIRVPLTLAGDLASIAVDSLAISVAYDRSLLKLEGFIPNGPWSGNASPPTFDATHAHSTIIVAGGESLAAAFGSLEFTVLFGRVLNGFVFADSVYVPNRSNVRIAADSAIVSIAEFCDAEGRLLSFGGDLLVRANPNPSSSMFTIEYTVAAFGPTRVALFDAGGRELLLLVDGVIEPGTYRASIDARGLGSGTYYCSLVAGRFMSTTVIRVEE